MFNNREYNYTCLTTGSTSQIFSGKGILFAINVNTSSAVAFCIYDGIASTSQEVGKLKLSIPEGHYEFNAVISSGLYVTYGAGADYTVLWSK